MKAFAVAVLAVLCLAGVGMPYDPPEIIGVLTSPQELPYYFASDFCWIGDQNGDGFDDLLVSQCPGHLNNVAAVYLYHGGVEVRNEPFFEFRATGPEGQDYQLGYTVTYFGHLLGNEEDPYIGLLPYILEEAEGIDLIRLGRDLNEEPEIRMMGGLDAYPKFEGGYLTRPCDFNGDGYDDLVIERCNVGLQVCFGGGELDTVADWSVPIWPWMYLSFGLDVNGDGCGDILTYTYEDLVFWYSVYLGGDPPDTIPAVRVRAGDYNLCEVFYSAMLPDINGDGYDEWGAYWWFLTHDPEDPRPEDSGFHIFMGGAEPDGEPDLMLADTPDRWKGMGPIAGGDFNGDGYGDIVVMTGGSGEYPPGDAPELQFHFGNRWIDEVEGERQPDLFVDLGREYGGEYAQQLPGFLGAVGDYNGDGADDFVWGQAGEFCRAVIFAGNRDWRAEVPQQPEPAQPYSLHLSASPNPFNNQISLSYRVSHPTNVTIAFFDIEGRMVERLAAGYHKAGEYSRVVHGFDSGIYFVLLQADYGRALRKIVCLR